MIYRAFPKQAQAHKSQARIRGAFAGKRGGKTEWGAIEAVLHTENQIGFVDKGIDPYLGLIIAPTKDMLRRLSLKKFLAYARPFEFRHHKTFGEIYWHNRSEILCISADEPKRIEGVKANWAWIDEVFQVDHAVFLEVQARLADNEGKLWCTGSLGVQYRNPRQHWAYKEFKETEDTETACFEWTTADNPYFPKKEIQRLKNTLDPLTFRQMFELSWDVPSTGLVYGDFSEANVIRGYNYNPKFETWVSIDWGWTHPLACGFFQYDRQNDIVYLFDEIVGSGITLEQLWTRIVAKRYILTGWICDIAGNQEREQTGISNVQWFAQPPRNISFKYRTTAITYGLPIVRTYIKNGLGQTKFYVDEVKCPKSLDGLKTYSYPEKNGIILNENPLKKDDDCADMIRYFFVNRLDYNKATNTFNSFSRFGG